jgi:hypothetical protein
VRVGVRKGKGRKGRGEGDREVRRADRSPHYLGHPLIARVVLVEFLNKREHVFERHF